MCAKPDGSSLDLMSLAKGFSKILYLITILFIVLAFFIHLAFYAGAFLFGMLLLIDIRYKYFQKSHAILRNFGLFGAMRYLMESIGPELRQYWIASDVEEKPFSRRERSEVYRYAKNIESTAPFGTLENLQYGMIRHSMYPLHKKDMPQFSLTFGEERNIKNAYTITKPFMVSAMSFGSLGENAVRAIARGAKRGGIPMCTGEGGYPKYHLMEKPDIIFQMGTAKFGVRNDDGSLNDEKLSSLASEECIKMIEIKFSQGAKPGKGGLLPGAKVTPEIAEIRDVPVGKDVYSPPGHIECDNVENTVKFIKRVQEVSDLPVGIKMCIGNEHEFQDFVREMKRQDVFPDYIDIDGAEGGTGAAPRSFLDYVGIPLFHALKLVVNILHEEGVRDKVKLLGAGKLVNPARQITAFSFGVDAVYTARGFMLALGCVQALQCNQDTCPVGITTHDKHLQRGLEIEDKAQRVEHYIKNLDKALKELLAATGNKSLRELRNKNIMFRPWEYN